MQPRLNVRSSPNINSAEWTHQGERTGALCRQRQRKQELGVFSFRISVLLPVALRTV